GMAVDWDIASYDLYHYFRDHTQGFEELAAFQADPRRIGVRRSGDPRPAESFMGEYVSGNYFATLGVPAFAGRTIGNEDDRAGAPPVAMMAFRAWQEQFASDPSVIGATFNLNGTAVTIVGITPPAFFGESLRAQPPDFYMPIELEPAVNRGPWIRNPQLHWLYLMGRIQPGGNVGAIEAQMRGELQQWLRSWASVLGPMEALQIPRQTLHLHPAGSGIGVMRASYSFGLELLMSISGFVLLIVCANLANLMLVRGLARRRQTAISLALGATRARIVKQALTESVLLALLGGGAGVGIAFAATETLLRAVFGAQAVPIRATPDLNVLGFALGVSLITGIVFGIAPAWSANRAEPVDALRGAGRSTENIHSWPQRTLVILQAALSLVLLAAAGLLTVSLRNLAHQSFGFASENRLAVRIDPNLAGYKPDQLEALYREIRRRLLELPGCTNVSYSLYSPMSGNSWSADVAIDGQPPETVGTPLLRGRTILESDIDSAPHVAVVNQTFAHRFFPHEDPLGKHFGADPGFTKSLQIVGIAADAKYGNPGQPPPPMYFVARPQLGRYADAGTMAFESRSLYVNDIVLRFATRPDSVDAQIRRIFAALDPNLTVIRIQSFGTQIGSQLNQETLIARLAALFGLTALLLASIGLYGLISYLVAQRAREIGIRVALGADRIGVLRLVVRHAYGLVALGLAIGIPIALAMGRLIENRLFGIAAYNPTILGGAALALTLCALLAILVPARRAASLDPVETLRGD
ncbi:MAG TPA: ADOP family duplicated permease, partial [Bryobacteraceae bacterium]|nr:ADOP family duplicated permease [Bryobacteraceae bacterium]